MAGETIGTGAPCTCPSCTQTLELKVMRSNAGAYIGTECDCGPYSRESGYFRDRKNAQRVLDGLKTYGTMPSGFLQDERLTALAGYIHQTGCNEHGIAHTISYDVVLRRKLFEQNVDDTRSWGEIAADVTFEDLFEELERSLQILDYSRAEFASAAVLECCTSGEFVPPRKIEKPVIMSKSLTSESKSRLLNQIGELNRMYGRQIQSEHVPNTEYDSSCNEYGIPKWLAIEAAERRMDFIKKVHTQKVSLESVAEGITFEGLFEEAEEAIAGREYDKALAATSAVLECCQSKGFMPPRELEQPLLIEEKIQSLVKRIDSINQYVGRRLSGFSERVLTVIESSKNQRKQETAPRVRALTEALSQLKGPRRQPEMQSKDLTRS